MSEFKINETFLFKISPKGFLFIPAVIFGIMLRIIWKIAILVLQQTLPSFKLDKEQNQLYVAHILTSGFLLPLLGFSTFILFFVHLEAARDMGIIIGFYLGFVDFFEILIFFNRLRPIIFIHHITSIFVSINIILEHTLPDFVIIIIACLSLNWIGLIYLGLWKYLENEMILYVLYILRKTISPLNTILGIIMCILLIINGSILHIVIGFIIVNLINMWAIYKIFQWDFNRALNGRIQKKLKNRGKVDTTTETVIELEVMSGEIILE